MASESVYRVKKLGGTKNYGTLKYAMEIILIKVKLWQAVEPLTDEVIDSDIDQQAQGAMSNKLEKDYWTVTFIQRS